MGTETSSHKRHLVASSRFVFHLVLSDRLFLDQELFRLFLEHDFDYTYFELNHSYTTQGSSLTNDSNLLASVLVLCSSVFIWLGLRPSVFTCSSAKRRWVSAEPATMVCYHLPAIELIPVKLVSSRRWNKDFLIRFLFAVSWENSGQWKPLSNMLSLTLFLSMSVHGVCTTNIILNLMSALDEPKLFCRVWGRTAFMWMCDFSTTQMVWFKVWRKK